MKSSLLASLVLLTVILTFTLWNNALISDNTARWQEQLRQSDLLAQADDWQGATEALTNSYRDWSSHQIWLHIVSPHNAVDDAEAMYHRAMAFSAVREPKEFRAEIADLLEQLKLLAEMERFSLKNIL